MHPTRILTLLLLIPFICAAQSQKRSGDSDRDYPARIPIEGEKIFQYYCAACHGADARGHGSASAALKHAVPDLTLISKRNGGKFPLQRVKQIIEGNQPAPLSAHGNREMPIWGPIFHRVEADQDWGEVRSVAIVRYLESMQQK